MLIVDWYIKVLYAFRRYQFRDWFVYPFKLRDHLKEGRYIIVDCEFGAKYRVRRIIRAYLDSKLPAAGIPMLVVYRENLFDAYLSMENVMKRFKKHRLTVWFYESPTVRYGICRVARRGLAYINANQWFSMAGIDETLTEKGVKVCMFPEDYNYSWMFPNITFCSKKKEFLNFFNSLI